jgi:hypothetical protein
MRPRREAATQQCLTTESENKVTMLPYTELSHDRKDACSFNNAERVNGSFDDVGQSFLVYLAGFAGAVIAGSLYPAALGVLGFFGLLNGAFSSLGDLLLLATFGLLIGAVYAAITATLVFPITGLLQLIAGSSSWRVVWVSIAGGWTGFAAAVACFSSESTIVIYALTAMAIGQLGAGGMGIYVCRRFCTTQPHQVSPVRFRLIGLLRFTAAVAVLAAISPSIPMVEEHLNLIVGALVFQTLTTGAYFVLKGRPHRGAFHVTPYTPLL